MSDGRIVIDTDLDSSGIEAGLGKLKGVITKGAAALGVGKLAQEVVNVGKSFEAGMSEVQAISGASGKDLQALTNKAKEMGATTKFSATQSAEALKYMAMAGWKTNDMVDGLGGVMNLAAASGEDLGTVSDIVTDALTAFGLQAKDSGHFADVLAKASSNSNTNVSMMGETFKYVAPLAGAMKYSVEDTATAIGLMANAGIKGSQSGTSLRSMLTRLVKPPKEAAEAMSALGISVTKSDGSMKPLRETMAELREKFSGLTESQKASYASSIAGQEAMSGLLAIVNTSDKDFDKLTKAIDNSSGAAKKQADTMNQNLQGALYELGSAAESLGIEMYEHIKKPLTKAVDFGAKKVRGLSSALKKGKIEDIVSPESVETVKTLGSAAKTVGSVGLKALGAGAKVAGSGVKLLADNLDKAVPLALSLGTAYKALEISNGVKAGTNAIGRAVKWWDAATVALGHYAEQMEAAKFTGRMYNVELTTSQMILGVFTGQVSIATLATEGFNAAMTALGGPVGIAVAGVTALAVGLTTYAALQNRSSSEEDELAKSIDKATKSRKEYTKTLSQNQARRQIDINDSIQQGSEAERLTSKLESLMAVEKKSKGVKEQIKTVVSQLNDIYPDLNLKYDAEKDKLNKSTSAIRKNIAAQKELAIAKAYGAQIESITKDQVETEEKLSKATDQQEKAQERLNKAKAAAAKAKKEAPTSDINAPVNADWRKAEEQVRSAQATLDKADANVQKYKDSLNSLDVELDKAANKQISETNYATFLQDLDKLAKDAGVKAKNIPASVENGIKEGVYVNPTTGKELKNLIKLDDLMTSDDFTKMQEEGKQIPQYLSNGISEGTISFETATKKIQNALNWTDLVQKAKDGGKKIPDGIVQGIQSGEYAVPTSMKELNNLVKYDSLKAKADKAGVQIPDSLANAIMAGSMKPKEAAESISTMIKFTDAVQKAGIDGSEIPQELAEKVLSGRTSVNAAIKQLQDGIAKESDKAAKKTSKAKKDIESSTKIKAQDNSGAVNSYKKLAKTADSTSKSVAKSSATTKKNSKISATDNSASGKKTFGSYSKEAKKSASETKSAVKSIKSASNKAFASNSGAAKKAGAKAGGDYAKGIESKSGAVKSAGSKVAKSGISGAKSQKSGFVSVGANLASGIASGINQNTGYVKEAARSAVKAAKEAAKDEGDIGSPSKVFANEVGKWLPAGVGVGIRKNTKAATKASREMSAECLTASQKELDIHSPSKKFSDAVGKNIPRGVASGVKTAKRELIGEMQTAMKETLKTAEAMAKSGKYSEVGSNLMSNLSDSLSTAKTRASDKVQSAIDAQVNAVQSANDKKEEALQKKIDKTKNKGTKKRLKKQLAAMKKAHTKEENKLSKAGEKVANAFNSAFEKESNRLTDIAQKKLQELSETYQKKYDEIISLRDSLTDKQQSYGNVYDLAQNIADIERYQADLKALENKIPKSMMERILGMNVDEATAYMDWFRGMTKEQQGAYVKNWKKQQSMSEIFSKSFFADDLEKIQTEYSAKIKAATKDFEKQMNNAGKNIAKGLSAGITSETRSAEKAMKKLCYSMIKTAKKSLGIHSPSREFSKIGVRDIEGLEVGHEKKAKSLYRQMDSLSGTMAQRFANAKLNVPDITARLQSAVDKQAQAIMARMQPVVNQQLVQSQQTPANHFPENITISIPINGREVAKETFPFMDLLLGEAAARKMRGGV